MQMKRMGSAVWKGSLKDGKGSVSTESGALKQLPYSFSTRFEDHPGTNPEELIGAAHAGCFSMALSKIISEAGFEVVSLETSAQVTLGKVDGGFAITDIHLILKGNVPGVSDDQFQQLASQAKEGCPVSKVLNANISLEASLTS